LLTAAGYLDKKFKLFKTFFFVCLCSYMILDVYFLVKKKYMLILVKKIIYRYG